MGIDLSRGFLKCASCGKAAGPLGLVCSCGGVLEQHYSRFPSEPPVAPMSSDGIWRWRDALPVEDPDFMVTLGEGNTPMILLRQLSDRLGQPIYVKDEGQNPTGTFKARGAATGVGRLAELGWKGIGMPTVGSGGSAWAAYAAALGIEAIIGLPDDLPVPSTGEVEPFFYGATVRRYGGDLPRAFSQFRADLPDGIAYVGAFREPYRLEGDKTLLFEIVEQFGWSLPSAIVWPTGGAVGLVGIAKALDELYEAGWLERSRDFTIVSAQHSSAAPIADALRLGRPDIVPGEASGIAPGVWVGNPFAAGYIIDRVVGTAKATGVAVGDDEIRRTLLETAQSEGLLLSPEGALGLAAAVEAVESRMVPTEGAIVVVNTASVFRYPSLVDELHQFLTT